MQQSTSRVWIGLGSEFGVFAIFFAWLFWYQSRRRKRIGSSTGSKSDRSSAKLAGEAVSMPLDFLRPDPRKLAEVPVGDIVFIDATDIAVDLNGKTFVDLGAHVIEKSRPFKVKVEVDEKGYGLVLPRDQEPPLTFPPRRLYSVGDYGSVIDIVIEDRRKSPLDSG